MAQITGEWLRVLKDEFHQPYYKELYYFIQEEYRTYQIYPPAEEIYNALHLTPFDLVKVVILGQDPYHGINQAHGLSFSVPANQRDIPPSLKNIYKELHEDLGIPIPATGNLEFWARQGVLLLNTVLTVRAHEAFSHRNRGWEKFTDAILRALNERETPIVFLLWGNPAKEKATMLNNPKHLVLKAAHPSPLAANKGFFGCRHFSKANAFLRENGLEEIDWRIG